MAYAKNFYLSSKDGDDKYTFTQAQSPSTPWKSVAKLNEITSQLLPGDTVLFKRGEVFYGSVAIKASGTILRPIVITSYGSGAKPVITGLTKLDSWKSLGNGIYESPYPSGKPADNMVIMNGVPKAVGRFPNSGYLSYESSSTNSITDKELLSSPNWTGAEIVVRKNHWIIDRNPISSHKGNVIGFITNSTYPGISGFGYFIQNDQRALDSLGEWFFNPKTKSLLMYFGAQSPSNYTVKTAAVDTLVYLNKVDNILINNLSFQGSNKTAVQISDAQNINIQNCDFDYSGYNAITGSSKKNSSPGFKIENCTINHSNNNAIDLDWSFSNASIKNNSIKNTGTMAGMGGSGDGKYLAIFSRGANTVIEYNAIDSTGYSGIFFKGSSVVVKNNFVNHSCLIKDDGGGIYTYRDSSDAIEHGKQIIGNIVLNSQGASDGTNPKVTQAQGIYLDGNTMNVDVLNNTAANCTDYGLFLNGSQGINIKGNTFFNNNIQLQMYNWGPGIRNVAIEDNIFFSKLKTQMAIDFYTKSNDINKFGSSDKNFFSRPIGDELLFHTQSTIDSYPGKIYSLSSWTSAYNQDLNSKKSPVEIPDYKLNRLLSANKVPQDYLTNKNHTAVWPSDNLISLENNKENKKVLKVSLTNSSAGKEVLMSVFNIGAVNSNKNYILKFKAVSEKERVIKVYLSQTKSPYANLSQAKYQKVSSTSKDVEVLFNTPVSEADARIVFQLNSEDGPLWLDNIELYEADISITRPDDYIRFEYNATNAVKVISLDKPYVDAKNNLYQNKLSLQPFSSVVLIALGEPSDKSSQTISFPAVPDKVYGDSPFKLIASSSSGLPVGFNLVSGPATIKDDIITITGAGIITIEASQSGDGKYNPASAVTQSFTVNKAKQSISFAALPTKTFGDGPFALTASCSSGLAPVYRVISGPVSLSGNTVTLTGTGIGMIEASQSGDNNYHAASSVIQSFSIVAANVPSAKTEQNIVFSNIPAKIFGAAPFTLQAASSSGLPVSYSVAGGPATISDNVITLTGTGNITIEYTQSGNEKYNAAPAVRQVFKVEKANQTIAFANVAVKTYGDAPFILSASAGSGLPITYNVVSGPATVSGDVVTLTGAGAVTIEASLAGNEQYYPAVITQTFVINKADQRISITNIDEKTVDDVPFRLLASSNTQEPISFASSDPSVVVVTHKAGEWTATILRAGVVTITASQPENDLYSEASISYTFRVNEQSLSIASAPQLNTFPNPFMDRLNIMFISGKSGYTTLRVYDLQGRMIKSIFEGKVTAGEPQNFIFEAMGLKPGVYIVRLATVNKTLSRKVILS